LAEPEPPSRSIDRNHSDFAGSIINSEAAGDVSDWAAGAFCHKHGALDDIPADPQVVQLCHRRGRESRIGEEPGIPVCPGRDLPQCG
jgi:hypothetical protein